MKTLEEIRSALWFKLRDGSKVIRFRLDERDWKEIVAAIENNGWVIMPRELTADMPGDLPLGSFDPDMTVAKLYAALIETRPRHDEIGKAPASEGFGKGDYGT